MELSRDDRRFVPSHGVAERLKEGNNLAAMDWEDFEHLIREIFEKEFSSNGGEVKVTQASRDGGVDAGRGGGRGPIRSTPGVRDRRAGIHPRVGYLRLVE